MKKLMQMLVLTGMFLMTLSACSPLINVYSEEEPGVNLRKYRNYEWLDNKSVESDNVMYFLQGETENWIEGAVDQEMSRLTFKKCNQDPDLKLHYHVIVKSYELYYQDWWCDDETWNKYGRCDRMRTMNFKEGTLIVDLIDARTGNQVWRGVAVSVLDQVPKEQVQKRINQAVKEIFKKFPNP